MKLNIVSIAGGLGNQMFQYAFYLSLKNSIFPKDCNKIFIAPYDFHNGYELDRIFKIRRNTIRNLTVGFIKKYFKTLIAKKQDLFFGTFEPIKIQNSKPIRYFSGWWQSEKYFVEIEEIGRAHV